jgi:hypothetical protein
MISLRSMDHHRANRTWNSRCPRTRGNSDADKSMLGNPMDAKPKFRNAGDFLPNGECRTQKPRTKRKQAGSTSGIVASDSLG